jgi:hypothetical protein
MVTGNKATRICIPWWLDGPFMRWAICMGKDSEILFDEKPANCSPYSKFAFSSAV